MQYFVYVVGGYTFSPIPVDLVAAPSPDRFFSVTAGGSKGAWFDSGSKMPTALEDWSAAGTNDSRSRLISVEVYFGINATGLGNVIFSSYGVRYSAIGGSLNASSVGPFLVPGVLVNGTVVRFVLPDDEMLKVEEGQLIVDRPMSVSYAYSPEFYFNLKTPSGGFEGWVVQNGASLGKFSYSAPTLAGLLGTQRFARWVGTVNSTSPTLSLAILKPYVETAYYATDFGALASVIWAAAALVIGGYIMLRQHRRVSGKNPRNLRRFPDE